MTKRRRSLNGQYLGWKSPSGSLPRRSWRRCGIGTCGATPGRKPGLATAWMSGRSWTRAWASMCWTGAFWSATGMAIRSGRWSSPTSTWRTVCTPPPGRRCGGIMTPGPVSSLCIPAWLGWTRVGTSSGNVNWITVLSESISPPCWTTGTVHGRSSAGETSVTSA